MTMRDGMSDPVARTPLPDRVDVLGVGISCTDLPRAVETLACWIEDGEREYVCVTGMHGVMECQHDSGLRLIHNESGLTTPDGMPMVWAGRWAGAAISRVYGPDLMELVFARAVERGWRNYFLGGTPDAMAALLDTLALQYPDLEVAGSESPPFRDLSEAETDAQIARINESGADIVWVCLGTPKQERWMAANRSALKAPVLVGVGAALDLVAGTLRQAPRWMQRSGLEWLFRLMVEPRRLWRRYLLNIPRFVMKLAVHHPRVVGAASLRSG